MEHTATEHSAWFEAFKAVFNFLSNPWLSFTIVIVVLFVGLRFRRYVFTVKVGVAVLLLEAVIVGIGLRDPNFFKIVAKPDNVPILAMLFVFTLFLWIAMVQAVNNDRRVAEKLPPEEKETSDEKTWVWPDLVYTEFISTIVASIVLVLWAVYLRAPLEEPANPAETPNPSKAPWYFLGLQEMLVYYDPWYAGVVLPTIIILGLCAIPYIDNNPKGSGYYTFNERKMAITTFLFGFLALWVFMIITGTFLRGPGWNFYGPFEYWDPHKIVALNNINLSEFVWVKWFYWIGEKTGIEWFKQGLPDVKMVTQLWPPGPLLHELGQAFKREFAGIFFLLFYFIGIPPLLAKTKLKKLYEGLGFIRYNTLMFLFLTMGTLPLKMVLRWTINLKYFVDTPWIKF
jgi:uncharacterized membrane protein